MKKGFTLMEILAVLLVIAVIASFAVPVVGSIIDEVHYHKAKVAAAKMAEAVRAFYRDSKGFLIGDGGINNSFLGRDAVSFRGTCNSPASSGLPAFEGVPSGSTDVKQLFYCEYLSAKDFAGLNYTFTVGTISTDYLVTAHDEDGNKEDIQQR